MTVWTRQHTMRKRLPIIIAYLALLALSLPIPLLHHLQTDRAIESLRPFIKLDDGSWSPMLMPVPILLLRSLGQLSWLLPLVVLAMFFLSFWREVFTRFSPICALAICQCAFTTLYALYATSLFGYEWLNRVT
jgi:hypothetical protein